MDDSNMDNNTNYDNGLKVRTEVMGEQHVKRSLDAATGFTQPNARLMLPQDLPNRCKTGLLNTLGAALGKMTQYYLVSIAH